MALRSQRSNNFEHHYTCSRDACDTWKAAELPAWCPCPTFSVHPLPQQVGCPALLSSRTKYTLKRLDQTCFLAHSRVVCTINNSLRSGLQPCLFKRSKTKEVPQAYQEWNEKYTAVFHCISHSGGCSLMFKVAKTWRQVLPQYQ